MRGRAHNRNGTLGFKLYYCYNGVEWEEGMGSAAAAAYSAGPHSVALGPLPAHW
jgi:hypothetical protein